jgi:hypothetical protein
MIKPETKYMIVGVHKNDTRFYDRDAMHGTIIEAVSLRRWLPGERAAGYYYGMAKRITGYQGRRYYAKPGSSFCFHAIYLRRVKEEAK